MAITVSVSLSVPMSMGMDPATQTGNNKDKWE